MSNDERPDSLAAQAAAWVPPWERQQRPPDRAYQAARHADAEADADAGVEADADAEPGVEVEAGTGADGGVGAEAAAEELLAVDDLVDDDVDEAIEVAGPVRAAYPDDDEDASEAGLSDDDDDFDEEFERPNPPGYRGVDDDDEDEDGRDGEGAGAATVPPELAALPGEAPGAAMVDAPQELPGEAEPAPTDVGPGAEVPLPEAIEQAAGEGEPDAGGEPVDAPFPADGDDAGEVFDAAADDDVSDDTVVDLPFTEVVPDDGEEVAGDEAGAGPVEAQPATRPAAESIADAERAQAGSGVPAQGRRRRAGADASGDATPRTSDDVDLPEPMAEAELAGALEAIMLVVDEPVAEMQLAQILEQPTERVAAMLEDLSARYTGAGHGFDLRRVAGGWRLYTRPEYAAYVERFVLDGQSVRLTQAALETLAVVAYKQPVTRSRISAIRGVNCDGVMRTLVTRGLIEECGTESETGAYLYRTTALFLEKLGLNSVEQLPPLAPFLPDDVEEVLDATG